MSLSLNEDTLRQWCLQGWPHKLIEADAESCLIDRTPLLYTTTNILRLVLDSTFRSPFARTMAGDGHRLSSDCVSAPVAKIAWPDSCETAPYDNATAKRFNKDLTTYLTAEELR
ncbi:predicted protein [Coccidioides posadasii str. Silveira]|uniref:Predicted protein n=2 Tax=Coccidioides posadasii TaxID=199306 RepID=E9D3Z5_COCPS|nr:predicted protein [Coccidioides posadasii str. Silveira]KMM72428.1 hypothetical protein CPAG_08722 [Coccidioides posadasii RMSCC 3488]